MAVTMMCDDSNICGVGRSHLTRGCKFRARGGSDALCVDWSHAAVAVDVEPCTYMLLSSYEGT
eukprot:53131-Eustigmatos_ZCMA.PRE.1